MKNIMISHGEITHPLKDVDNCPDCIQVQIDYYKALKKYGGVKGLVKYLKKEIKNEKGRKK
jgi:hypothetical protein